MRIRYRGHSCVEITGKHHILIDPDFTRDPLPGVEYICITHAHNDHIGQVAEVTTGSVVASPDVCEIAAGLGVSRERLGPVQPGEQVANIQVLPGYSQTNGLIYSLMVTLFMRRKPEPAGIPLSFFIKDEATLLHIGDAHAAPLDMHPDILCLPWRKTPFGANRYNETLLHMVKHFSPRYILPIHYDLPYSESDPRELNGRVSAVVMDGYGWYGFQNKQMARPQVRLTSERSKGG